ncbi:Polycomb group RING finger protein 5 [Gaertneriomyces sp. JEL0708]|nr:Polycomb group RING finger protein 5 [Gaertneriomyces sp. JEL0708]
MNAGKTEQATLDGKHPSLVHRFLICSLCEGYLVDATTIDPCLHTFCKTCIYNDWKFQGFYKRCPTCNEELGANPLQCLKPDRTMQNIAYLMIPGLEAKEHQFIREFAAQQSAQLSQFRDPMPDSVFTPIPTVSENFGSRRSSRRHRNGTQQRTFSNEHRPAESGASSFEGMPTLDALTSDSLIAFSLGLDLEWFDDHCVPLGIDPTDAQLSSSSLKTRATTTVSQLKKHVRKRLPPTVTQVELWYNGQVLQEAWSMEYIARELWTNLEEPLVMKYRPVFSK